VDASLFDSQALEQPGGDFADASDFRKNPRASLQLTVGKRLGPTNKPRLVVQLFPGLQRGPSQASENSPDFVGG
jgi:hypothetical protein